LSIAPSDDLLIGRLDRDGERLGCTRRRDDSAGAEGKERAVFKTFDTSNEGSRASA
jgi:hypothetical protein